jgi:ATP-binding cassette, subfamily B, bacterial HlyB/CyaB
LVRINWERREAQALNTDELTWLIAGLAAVHRLPFDANLLEKQFPPPLAADAFARAAAAAGFDANARQIEAREIGRLALPLVVALRDSETLALVWALVLQADESRVLLAERGDSAPREIPIEVFAARFTGEAWEVRPQDVAANDPDASAEASQTFGFRWFIPELLKYKSIWREVVIASLVIQLMALGTPLFTQVIIDKVVVHHTQSTLMALAVGMSIFLIFNAALSWVRQYLVLHTGNRVDAVLGSSVMEHLFKLPPLYFQHRPTGVIAARLHGVETIREFIASAAVTLILDVPFLFIFVAIMFFYSVTLTLIALAILGIIVGLSALVAPLFQQRLQQQFLLGARNQAFVTEYVAGLETVKSLQLEPQVNERYRGYLASYLESSFKTKQLANTYNTYANALDQLLTLLILSIGAYIVMSTPAFTIGMLVAFQMFSSRLSQPMLRMVGLWQQFQQASLSVQRLGDIMNATAEPYTVIPSRKFQGRGEIEVQALSFQYAQNLPLLYKDFGLKVTAGQIVALTGPSGCGKSTLAKLLLGFYPATSGAIKLDGIDIRYLSANELRSQFGVVPQETILFSGTVYDNLSQANPFATFEQVVAACQMAEIHHTIEGLPNGYQTEIGERGAGLSGGQKQRLAIARALLKGPKILIFDEATSNLDLQTAEAFGRTVNALKGKVTMLFIAHALPRSLQVDQTIRIGEKLKVISPDMDTGQPS